MATNARLPASASRARPAGTTPATTTPPLEDSCTGCLPLCLKMGTPEEGWYNSCSNKLIWKARCAPRWSCTASPVAQCSQASSACFQAGGFCADPGVSCGKAFKEAADPKGCSGKAKRCCFPVNPCHKEGVKFSVTVPKDPEKEVCCPGLMKLKHFAAYYPKATNKFTCARSMTPTFVCAICGDGKCSKEENHCICPSDCPLPPPPTPPKSCQKDADCQNEPHKFCSTAKKCEWDCKSKSDCPGGVTCRQSGSMCIESEPVCTIGRCSVMEKMTQGTCVNHRCQ